MSPLIKFIVLLVVCFLVAALVVLLGIKLRARRRKFTLEVDTSSFTDTVQRLGAQMQAEIERRIGDMSTQDIVRAMMGRELARTVDEELMTGVEATTETIPPGTIPYTTSHTRPPDQQLRESIERMATQLMANEGLSWEEALIEAEANHTIQGTGPLPFIDPATGEFTDRDPGEVTGEDLAPLLDWMQEECRICEEFHVGELSNRAQARRCGLGTPERCQRLIDWEDEQPSLDQVLGLEPPLLEWMVESCRECSQFIMMNHTIDDSEQAILCGEGANNPCAVFGNYFDRQQRADPDADPPPLLYVWMDDYLHDHDACPRCDRYDPSHDLHAHALACHQCRKYRAWYQRGGARQIPQGHELVEPEAGPGEGVVWRPGPAGHLVPSDELGGMEVPPEVAEHVMDLAPSDVQADARVPARCPWMEPTYCDPCERLGPGTLPGTQAVICAGVDSARWDTECPRFTRWRARVAPDHFLLRQLRDRSARECKQIRVIRFKR